MTSAVNVLDAHSLLAQFGAAAVFVVLFVETGLLVGFLLPGDSLLVTAGLLAAAPASSRLHLNLAEVLLAGAAGAILGGQCGYLLGRHAGPALLARQRSSRLHEGAARADQLLARYGYGRALVLARFIPIVRTALNPLTGILKIPGATFASWNAIGGLLWTVSIIVAGYLLGNAVSGIDHYVLPIIAVVVVLSLLPLALEWRRQRQSTAGAQGGQV